MKKVFALSLLSLGLLVATPGMATEKPQDVPADKATEKSDTMVKVLKMAVSDKANAEMGILAETFKKVVEAKSHGTVKVEIYYDATLGEETETLHNVRSGALDMACVGVANLVPFAKRLGVVSLPYIFDTPEQVVAGTTGEGQKLLNSYARDGGFHVLAWVYSGFRHLSNSKHPVEKLDDMVGMKVRIPQSTAMLSTYKSWNAIPILLGWTDVFSALADRTVDGQCYGYSGFNGMNFMKAGQKYLTELHYNYLLQPLVISEKVFTGFSPELQKILQEAGQEAQAAELAYIRSENDGAKNALIVQGLKISKLEDEDEWKRVAVSTVWPEMAAFVGGKDAINAYLKAINKPEWHE